MKGVTGRAMMPPRIEHLGTTALILCAALLLPAVAGWGESESGLAGGISLLALNVGSDAPRVMTASGTVFSEDRCALCPGPFMHKTFPPNHVRGSRLCWLPLTFAPHSY